MTLMIPVELLLDLHLPILFKTPPVFAVLQLMAITCGCKESKQDHGR
jgi:hypothetical protein